MAYTLTSKGNCEPIDPRSLGLFKNVQSQANRTLGFLGKTLLKVDGIIGPKTVAAVNNILGTSYSKCQDIVSRITSTISSLSMKATSLGADSTPPKPPRSTRVPEVVVDPVTGNEVVKYKSNLLAGILPLDNPLLLLALGLGGYMAYTAYKQAPKKRKRKGH